MTGWRESSCRSGQLARITISTQRRALVSRGAGVGEAGDVHAARSTPLLVRVLVHGEGALRGSAVGALAAADGVESVWPSMDDASGVTAVDDLRDAVERLLRGVLQDDLARVEEDVAEDVDDDPPPAPGGADALDALEAGRRGAATRLGLVCATAASRSGGACPVRGGRVRRWTRERGFELIVAREVRWLPVEQRGALA